MILERVDMEKISVVIPTYNRAHYITRAVQSVYDQRYRNWELIVVDDGSTDHTLKILQPFLKDKRVKYLKKEKTGAAHSRNVGAASATGKFLTFLDSDDQAREHWLSSFAVLLEEGAKVVCCGCEQYDEKGNFLRNHYPEQMGSMYGNRTGRFTNGGVFILEKDLFDQVGGYDNQLRSGQHSELALRLFKIFDQQDIEIHNLQETLIKLHTHQGEKIRRDPEAIFKGSSRVLKKHRTLFLKDKKRYFNYLSVAAVAAFRTGRYREGKTFFLKAFRLKPFKLKGIIRLFISFVPGLREKVWNIKKRNNVKAMG